MLDAKLETKPDRGVRRRCSHCSAPFYDMLRSPITCPKCGSKYAPTVALRRARATPTGTDPEPVVVAAREAEAEAEDVEEKGELDDEDKDADTIEDDEVDEVAPDDGSDEPGKPALD